MPKHSENAWFVKLRGSYIPCSLRGWLTYIPFILFLVVVLVVSYGSMHLNEVDIMDGGTLWYYVFIVTLVRVAPAFVLGGVIMTWIARKKS